MARIDASKLSEMLTIEDIKKVMSTIGGHYKSEDNDKIVYNSICHNSESYKLWLGVSSKRFYCHKCSESYNIYQLVMKQKGLTFPQALQYVCEVCGIPYEKTQRVTERRVIDDWQSSLGKYLKSESTFNNLQVYDDSILNFFETSYHMDWINEGISIETMALFGIKWYPYRNQIIIPVYSMENELVGIRSRNMNPEDIAKGMKYMPTMLANGTQYNFPTNQILYGSNITSEAIRRHKRLILCEGEKSVLKLHTWYGNENISVATFGSNLNRLRRDMILELGIEELIISLDWDYTQEDSEEYDKYVKKVMKIANQFTSYMKVSVLCSEDDKHEYKSNAMDYDKEYFEKTYENRRKVE